MKPFLSELRPQRDTVTTVLLGAWFITLGVLKILLMKFSENDHGGYDYLPVTVSVCAELLKLFVCGTIAIWVKYTEEGSFKDKFVITRHEVLSLLRWAVPGLLYFLDNLMQFYIITYFHPAMAVLLSNFVIITTSLLFRLVLKRVLTSIQWASLAILFLAIVSLSSQSHNVGPESSTVQKPQAIDHVVVSSLNHHDQICMVQQQNLISNETQFFLTAPIVLLAVFIYNAGRVKTNNNKPKHSASLVRTHDQEERSRPEAIELLPRQRHNSASKTSDEETEEEI
ncbi:PREDICTED: probable UDP-sugar transporter protein SLC35A5 isoform X2 [Branchiostoma belcheri]|uniref:Probable UDP-sugar transporter protein SLC35A5 isoform X2 n=1 Tax=Branchiostoma belcheri TaxID=7741 RepID=A0A6P4ZVA9_BRABE|nr:PREDICTED: probable UDP-sugar transporter protein SLC35A5 isoform X2 [Branchiostoma belcheri]